METLSTDELVTSQQIIASETTAPESSSRNEVLAPRAATKRSAAGLAREKTKEAMNQILVLESSSLEQDRKRPKKRQRLSVSGELRKRPLPARIKIGEVQYTEKDQDHLTTESAAAGTGQADHDQGGIADQRATKPQLRVLAPNEVLVSRKTSFEVYMRRCRKMVLKEGLESLTLQATGAAVPRALEIALVLQDELGGPAMWLLDVFTGTAKMVDDMILTDTTNYDQTSADHVANMDLTQIRYNSYVKVNLAQISYAERTIERRKRRAEKRRKRVATKRAESKGAPAAGQVAPT